MKKIVLSGLLSGLFLSAGILLAGQLILFNKTKGPVGYSLKFRHNGVKQEMVIGDFKLGPREKTRFPQEKDLHLASPLKLKVHRPGNSASASMHFDKNDSAIHNLQIEEENGRLTLIRAQNAPKKY
ncbi:hypothetical protein ACFLX2_01165 [Candidatus Dependentiae bacterium]